MSKSKINILFIIGLLLANLNYLYSQTKLPSPLKAGDTVPNLAIRLQTGQISSDVHLKDFEGKLILLDFWGVDCPGCIAGMPHMLELQQQFKDKIKVILVTQNTPEEIEKLWITLKKRSTKADSLIKVGRALPFITSDSIFWALFPHVGNPMHVWIDGDQIYRALAYPETTTTENISAFLQKKPTTIYSQRVIDVDEEHPLTWIDSKSGFQSQLKYYSFLLTRIESGPHIGYSAALIDSQTKRTVEITAYNKTLFQLYKLAYFHSVWAPDSDVLLNVKNESRFFAPKSLATFYEWADQNIYSYALKIPNPKYADAYEFLQRDLDRLFDLSSKIGPEKVNCVVLKRISVVDKLKSKREEQINEIYADSNELTLLLQNQPMSSLVQKLDALYHSRDVFIRVIDETNYLSNIDIKLPWSDEFDQIKLEDIDLTLKKYGLKLYPEIRTFSNILTIKEN